MSVNRKIYQATRFKSIENAVKKTKCSQQQFSLHNGVVYQLCYYPDRLDGKIKTFVETHAKDKNNFGANYNGYGWEDHYYLYYLTKKDGEELLALIEEEKEKKCKKQKEKDAKNALRIATEPQNFPNRFTSDEWNTLMSDIQQFNSEDWSQYKITYNDFNQREIQPSEWELLDFEYLEYKISSASTKDELWTCWLKLGEMNASAHKGYRWLPSSKVEYNKTVYRYKDIFLQHLSLKWSQIGGKLIYSVSDEVLYAINDDGWQVSFHRAPTDAIKCSTRTYEDVWDHIYCSWSYDNSIDYQNDVCLWRKKDSIEKDSKEIYYNHIRSLNDRRNKLENRMIRLILEDDEIRKYYAPSGHKIVLKECDEYNYRRLTVHKDYLIDRFGVQLRKVA